MLHSNSLSLANLALKGVKLMLFAQDKRTPKKVQGVKRAVGSTIFDPKMVNVALISKADMASPHLCGVISLKIVKLVMSRIVRGSHQEEK